MGQTALKYSAVLIAVYLVGAAATGWGQLMLNASTGVGTVVRRFQGR